MKSVSSNENDLQEILERIGKVLTGMRKKKGFKSHADFSAAHHLATIQYWRIEKGKANVTLKSLNKVANIHGLSLHDVFDLAKPNGKGAPGRVQKSKKSNVK